MYYRIISEIPGRLRIRCGALVMNEREAYGVSTVLFDLDGVVHAEAHSANGSILVVFDPEKHDDVLETIRALDVTGLPRADEGSPAVPAEVQLALEDNRFSVRTLRLIAGHVARMVLLPAPLRALYAIVRSVGFVARGLRALAKRKLTVDVIDATAMVVILAMGQFSEASSVMLLINLSSVMDEHVERRMRLSLSQGLVVRPERVWALVDGKDVQVPVSSVGRGMTLRFHAGSAIPIDGTVVEGEGSVNEAAMTGESRLVHKRMGSTIYAGTTLEEGELVVRVVNAAGEARIDEIVNMVVESGGLKASAQSRAEHLADSLVPVSFFGFFLAWALSHNMASAMVLLVVDYSCAIRLSMPIAVMSAMNEAYRNDVVVKGGRYLEEFAAADTVVFDKTGTLTIASPEVEKVIAFGDCPEDEVLRITACIEEHFPHSVARAIIDSARQRGLQHDDEQHAKVNYVVAHGVSSTLVGNPVVIGSHHFVFEDEDVPCPEGLEEFIDREAPASSVVYMAIGGSLAGAICVSDPLREDAEDVIDQLKHRGIRDVIMLTGDSETAASSVASSLGIDQYLSQMLPEDKRAYIQRLHEEHRHVVMVGDGINDSPALAAADVSVAMADASDVARNVADITVLDESLQSLVTTRDVAARMSIRIRRDYRFIVAYNSVLIVLGLAGVVPVATAALLHNVASLALAAANTRRYLKDGRLQGKNNCPKPAS
jgi:heavy metal translocating P-type ATPase